MKLSLGSQISLKLVVIVVLSLVLGFPLLMIQATISERQGRLTEVATELARSWGGEQQVAGPLFVVPYTVTVSDAEGKVSRQTKQVTFLPEELQANLTAQPEIRQRGIFDVVVYRAEVKLQGRFALPDVTALRALQIDTVDQVHWQEARLVVGMSDMHNLKGGLGVEVNGRRYEFLPDSGLTDLVPSGMHAPLPDVVRSDRQSFEFAATIAIDGSRSLAVAPLGKATKVHMQAPWPTPSFTGANLPSSRDLRADGFSADWELSYFGRAYPQVLDDSQNLGEVRGQFDASRVGVDFYQSVDAYQQTERALKYGFMIILLTFLAYFVFEVQMGLRIHVIQYGLIGLALAVFFLLLLALAEHVAFGFAYTLAAIAVTCQIGLYSWRVVGSRRGAAWVSVLMTALYAYLYFLLQLADYALLLGAVSLFAILAGLMFATRKVDWFGDKA